MSTLFINAVMITCAARQEQLAETLESWLAIESIGGDPATTGVVPLIVSDTEAVEGRGLSCDRPQTRQELVSRMALERGLQDPRLDYLLFLEDDLRFNRALWHNLGAWAPLRRGEVTLASLYNPNIRELKRHDAQHWFVADPEAVYGSQAMLLSRACAEFILAHWDEVPGMQDIKFSRLAARMGRPLYYHTPSLVQHEGRRSAWTTDDRFHQTADFDPDWRAQ